ncbi:hypothetical protein Pmar_PMAR008991 [Perkinsus marinus ATCC 50983]|uniref:Uncharacterized protein n=1 Tax=Perkinsus marinus (strain ATCC 50983 / TXsc) TaxID=423536 RepID=C5LM78_PERM5|nr:hypothetical protein Pmar_PMAR008991 [Perkinsus marinus ATCC 50983]EER02209.1 hypothetical protein Pmar_PMAR008991 [Perkinsus marinus ATCC 50983]|eukprot:XP_002769491.1 hypothetical protein Pmar_PMAR008991 [Perkinsus marinus ATCC 50983]
MERVAEAHAKIRQTLRVAGLLRELQASYEERQKALINRLSVLEEEVGETVLLTMRLTKRQQAVMARQAALESKMAHVIDLLKRRREDSQLKDLQRKELWHANCRLIDLTRGQLTQQKKLDSSSPTDQDLEIAKCSILVNEKDQIALGSGRALPQKMVSKPVLKTVQKFVEVPQIEYVDKYVDVPVKKYVEVVKEVKVPQVVKKYVEKVVEYTPPSSSRTPSEGAKSNDYEGSVAAG